MAQIKINRSSARVANIQTPNLSALRLDSNLALNYGAAIASVGKIIEDAKAKTQKTQDNNDARALFTEAQKTIIEEAAKYSQSSNVDDVNSFYQSVHLDKFKPLLKDYNEEVQTLFATSLYKMTNDTGMKLFATILKEHGAVTQENIKKDIFNNNLLAASNDPHTRWKANKENERIFSDPNTVAVFGVNGVEELKNSSILEIKLMQYSFKTKNNPTDILALGEKHIANDVANETLAKQIIQNAENTLIAQSLKEDKINEINLKADKEQKLNNFAYVLKKLNAQYFLNSTDKDISLDDINDLYKKDQLNSSQRDALYNLFDNPNKLSEQNIVDMIEGSMLIAETVDEIDQLKEQILLDLDYVAGLGLKDFAKYNTLFEKYSKDQPAYTEYQNNLKLLEADLGKVTSGAFTSLEMLGLKTPTAIKANEKLRINAIDHYKDLIINGVSPADAYIQTTKSFLRGNTIPGVKDFTNISSIILTTPTDEEKKSPSLYIENKTNNLLELYKKGQIDIDRFSNDISALDSIQNLINLRIDLKVDPFGFDAEEKTTKPEKLPDRE